MSDTATKRTYPAAKQKVPPFARYEGTSAWHKDRKKMKAYALYRAAQKQKTAAEA